MQPERAVKLLDAMRLLGVLANVIADSVAMCDSGQVMCSGVCCWARGRSASWASSTRRTSPTEHGHLSHGRAIACGGTPGVGVA